MVVHLLLGLLTILIGAELFTNAVEAIALIGGRGR